MVDHDLRALMELSLPNWPGEGFRPEPGVDLVETLRRGNMGGFKCGCGNIFSGSHNPGQQFRLVPDELFDQIAWPAPADLDTQERQRAVEASFSSLYVCGNCGRLHRNGESGSIISHVADVSLPRIWADFALRDGIGRILLCQGRSLADIRRQKLLLNPPLPVVLYDESGAEALGEAEFGLDASGGYDETLWAVRLDDRPA
ncbi:hypothetical protein ACN6LA_000589 [Streptomyces sp. SAS_269]|uniref:hypothetical protein n=1 Tax=Streptomyces sp. SAS_269 TaxID=3412749 RepID=UPI00403D477E